MHTLPKSPPEAIQLQRNKHEFSTAQDYLNADLARAIRRAPPKYSRFLAGGLCIIMGSVITWSAFSKVDEVATAQGEVIPFTRIQPVRALAGGPLRDIQVKEGEQVEAGQPLIQLDPSISEAEFQRLQNLLALTENTLARLEAERSNTAPANDPLQKQLMAARSQEFEARQVMAETEANRQLSSVKAAEAELQGLQASLEVANIKARSFGLLLNRGAVPRLDYLDAQNQVVSLNSQIVTQEQAIYQAQQAYRAAQAEADRLSAGRQSEILTQIERHRQELANLEGQLAQAEEQRDRETITASVNGKVYNIKIAEAGATVQAGEELLSIIPDKETLILEAKVLNRDIGFIQPGMPVKVKVETFPYQEFGLLSGIVLEVSPNAVKDEKLGLIYPTRIRLDQNAVQIRGHDVPLTPGMSATAEIVTRQKTVLSFIIEPLIDRWDRAFSVR